MRVMSVGRRDGRRTRRKKKNENDWCMQDTHESRRREGGREGGRRGGREGMP